MKFMYLGDGDPNTLETVVFGHTFPVGEAVDADLTDVQAAKLGKNPMFAADDAAKPAKAATKAVAAAPAPPAPVEPEPAPEPAPEA